MEGCYVILLVFLLIFSMYWSCEGATIAIFWILGRRLHRKVLQPDVHKEVAKISAKREAKACKKQAFGYPGGTLDHPCAPEGDKARKSHPGGKLDDEL